VTYIDDADIDIAVADRPLTQPELEALGNARSFMERGGFATSRQSPSFAIELLAGGAVAMLVVGLILAMLRPMQPRPLPASSRPTASPTATPTPSASPTQTTVPLDIIAQLNLGSHYVDAMAVSPNAVWLAIQGVNYGDAGTLIRVDPKTARKTASWTIGGNPAAVAAAGDFVWVANGVSDGSAVLPKQNTVEQFNAATGALVHIYRVNDPRGLVANLDSALVISASNPEQTAISLLAGGFSREIASLPGVLQGTSVSAESGLAECGHQVYMALTNSLATGANAKIYSVPPTGGAVHGIATIASDFAPAMVCDGTSLYLPAPFGKAGQGSLVRVSVSTGAVTTLWQGPGPQAMAVATGRLWITSFVDVAATNESTFLSSLDPVTGVESSTRWFLPAAPNIGDPDLLIPGASGLWTVAGAGNLLLHIAVG
jgi:hypothetical protein